MDIEQSYYGWLDNYTMDIEQSYYGWLDNYIEGIFTGAVGTAEHLCEFSEHVGLKRTHGMTNAQAYLNSA